jgi:hypothetical protein
MDIDLHQRRVADAAEAVHLAGLDHEDVAGSRFELLAIHCPASAPFADELHFVVRMTMRPRSAPRRAVEQKDRDANVALIGADEIVRAAAWRSDSSALRSVASDDQ